MKRFASLVVLAALVLGACGTADASGPPSIEFGRDTCVECGMIITDARFATSYRLADGAEKKFDDLGDMVLHIRSTGDQPADDSMWVADFETEEWVLAAVAHYVPTTWVPSPMGHSILAFSDMDRAVAFAAEVEGDVIGWNDVLAMPESEGLLGQHHHMDEMGHSGTNSDDSDGDETGHDH